MLKRNTIRFYRKYGFMPTQLAGKDFDVESFETSQVLFDQRSCNVRLTVEDNLFKLFNGLCKDIEARVTLSDGTVYILSELSQMSQMPVYDFYGDVYNKPGDRFNTKLTFSNWKVELPYKHELDSTTKYNCMLFDLESMFRDQAATEAARKLDEEINKLDEVLLKELGIKVGADFSREGDHTASAMMRAEELRKMQAENFVKRAQEACAKLYKVNSIKPVFTFNPVAITSPVTNDYTTSWRAGYVMPQIVKVELPPDKKDANDLSKEELNELLQETNKEKENDIMKINNKELKQIIIDKDRKTVTTITEEATPLTKTFGLDPLKKVTVAKASKDDEFDPYVGVAMTLAYQLFGSKEEFRKFVRESELVTDVKKNKETKLAEKEAKKKAAQEAHEKAVARKAEQAKKDEETATELLAKLAKYFNKSKKTKKTKKDE